MFVELGGAGGGSSGSWLHEAPIPFAPVEGKNHRNWRAVLRKKRKGFEALNIFDEKNNFSTKLLTDDETKTLRFARQVCCDTDSPR